jgi:LCP family protein required for cell wall assembly
MAHPSMGGEGMTDTRNPDEFGQDGNVMGTKAAPSGRRRRGLRAALVSLASVIVLLGAAAAGTYIFVNHEVGSIPRVPVKFLAQDSSGGTTILLTDSQVGPTGVSGTPQVPDDSGLIMLLHLSADQKTGGVVSLPPQAEVNVPGYGTMPLSKVTAIGGPSLLTQTVHGLTGVLINHYARIDFTHVASVVDALGGVSVTLPNAEQSFGHVFPQGVNQINGAESLQYARQPSLTEAGRVLRQGNLMRAVFGKMAEEHFLTNPLTLTRVLNALTSMLTVDSTFTNSQILSQATHLGGLARSASTFVTAPTETANGAVVLNPTESTALWSAIKKGSLASFARQYPDTLTPAAP